MSALDYLRAIEPDARLSPDIVFNAIFEASESAGDTDREDGQALEIAIRLLEARRTKQLPESCVSAVEMLVEECGLYPYVEPDKFSLLTQSIIESHAVQLDIKLYLHAKQMQILLWLLNGDNVILSAPTSFGKSVLIDAFLFHKPLQTAVMILPTIALIDETRRRLSRRFGRRYEIITTVSEEYDPTHPTIFVLTQERFIQRKDIQKIDLFFVDEFYKLDPSRRDERFETLNIAVYKALPRSRQCFMAGPHITGINLGDRWRGSFRVIQTDYRTVSVNVFDRSQKVDRLAAFLEDLRGVGEESSIVFTATPGSAHTLMGQMLAADVRYSTQLGAELGKWIRTNYHENWPVAAGIDVGLAVHHGRLPRSLGQLFVQFFDAGDIKVLICTSTLIEGVNTSAANVFIYDKKINRVDFDFFSFANIRGRVGRMMRHFVGSAFLYHEAPEVIETRVDVPVLSHPEASTDYILMNVDGEGLSPLGRQRQVELATTTGLSDEILREHVAIGADLLVSTYNQIKNILDRDENLLLWSGFPENKEQRTAVAELALKIAHTRQQQTGLHTAPQVGWAWSQLAKTKTLPAFLRWFSRTFFRDNVQQGIDEAFRFLQACEFGFPRSIAAIEALVHYARPEAKVSYVAYIAAIENWFRPPWLKQLDEMGVPLPLAERLRKYLNEPDSRREAIDQIRKLDLSIIKELSKVDRAILKMALG